MSKQPSRPEDLLPLSPPVLHILLSIGEHQLHGYAIMQEFEEKSGGREVLLPGTLYSSIARMLDQGLIEESSDPPEDGSRDKRRRYYKITDWGRQVVQAELQRMQALIEFGRGQSLTPTSAS